MARFAAASILLLWITGCSSKANVPGDVEQQRAALEKQQQAIAEMSKSMEAKDAENRELNRKLAATQAQINQVAQQVERQAQRPTYNVEKPTFTVERRAATPAVRKKSADLIIQSVNVYGTNENGAAWDQSGPPDPKVHVETSSASFTTPHKSDTETASFNVKAFRVTEGDTLEVTVFDNDVAFDDEIGTYSKLITADTLSQGTVTWSFGRVFELVLKFEP